MSAFNKEMSVGFWFLKYIFFYLDNILCTYVVIMQYNNEIYVSIKIYIYQVYNMRL